MPTATNSSPSPTVPQPASAPWLGAAGAGRSRSAADSTSASEGHERRVDARHADTPAHTTRRRARQRLEQARCGQIRFRYGLPASGLIARATSLHPPGAPEVDASRQPARRDRALSNSVAKPGQAAVPDEAVGACSRACRTSKPVPRSSDAAARRATVSDPDVAPLSSPKLSSAPTPNGATRATIAFLESDRPDGREPTMPMPRTQSHNLSVPRRPVRTHGWCPITTEASAARDRRWLLRRSSSHLGRRGEVAARRGMRPRDPRRPRDRSGAKRPAPRPDPNRRGAVVPSAGHGLGRDLPLLSHGHLRATGNSLGMRGE